LVELEIASFYFIKTFECSGVRVFLEIAARLN